MFLGGKKFSKAKEQAHFPKKKILQQNEKKTWKSWREIDKLLKYNIPCTLKMCVKHWYIQSWIIKTIKKEKNEYKRICITTSVTIDGQHWFCPIMTKNCRPSLSVTMIFAIFGHGFITNPIKKAIIDSKTFPTGEVLPYRVHDSFKLIPSTFWCISQDGKSIKSKTLLCDLQLLWTNVDAMLGWSCQH